ncbi:MAG: polysaccharide biosynthesis/export family protein [Candidatus Acidiferrales bacterium]
MQNHIWILKILAVPLILLSATPSVTGQSILSAKADDGGQPATVDKTARKTPDENGPAIHQRNSRYTIHPSDTLELSFMLTPDFNQTVTVQPDGYITLRYVGDLRAAGHTLPELTESIKTAYSKILHDPVISVDPKDFEKPYFVVGGQVGKPGKFDWRGEVTLSQAIAMAGGFTDAAKHSQVLLFRRVSDQWTEARIINMKKMLNARNLQEDPVLQPGDMLYVPKNALSKIKPFLPTTGVGTYYNPATY